MKIKTPVKSKIFHLTAMDSTHYGAKERYFVEFARQCRQKGISTILQYESKPLNHQYLGDLKALGSEVVVFSTLKNPVAAIQSIIRSLKKYRPEIVETHFVNKYVRAAVPMIARTLGVKLSIAFVRNMPFKKDFGLRKFLYNGYTHVFGVSQAISDYLVFHSKVNPKLVSTHYWGVLGVHKKSQQFRIQFRKELNIPHDATVIATIAFDKYFKGLDLLLAAFTRLNPEDNNIRLLIIGVNPDNSALPDLAMQLGVNNMVHWAGIRDQAWRLLNAADIYTQPSRDSEGLGIATIEAMALELPVVGTRVGGGPEATAEGISGYLAEPGDIDSLETALAKLVADPSRSKIMGREGFKRYTRLFDGLISVRNLIAFYIKSSRGSL